MSVSYDDVEQKLLAYIHPRKPATDAQEEALEAAVDAQMAFEDAAGFVAGVPGNVAAMANDGVSVTFKQGSTAPGYTSETISPVAWSILRNAGLIAYTLPTARKA